MIRIFAVCFFSLTLLVMAGPASAQNSPVSLPDDKETEDVLTAEEKIFYDRYLEPGSTLINLRARAVVNPHPYARPSLSPVYPDNGVSNNVYRQWELANHNWRRVTNAYDWDRALKYCGYCSYWR